jgi:hypothetical protein
LNVDVKNELGSGFEIKNGNIDVLLPPLLSDILSEMSETDVIIILL